MCAAEQAAGAVPFTLRKLKWICSSPVSPNIETNFAGTTNQDPGGQNWVLRPRWVTDLHHNGGQR